MMKKNQQVPQSFPTYICVVLVTCLVLIGTHVQALDEPEFGKPWDPKERQLTLLSQTIVEVGPDGSPIFKEEGMLAKDSDGNIWETRRTGTEPNSQITFFLKTRASESQADKLNAGDGGGFNDINGALKISTFDINSRFIENENLGKLFVITGKARNGYKEIIKNISITVKLIHRTKGTCQKKSVICGNILSESELRVLQNGAIQQRLKSRDEKKSSNVNVPPGGVIPFMLVFSDLPDKLDEFSVEVTGSTLYRPPIAETKKSDGINDKLVKVELLDVNKLCWLQECLRKGGFYQGNVDGISGPATFKAIEKYKAQYSLSSSFESSTDKLFEHILSNQSIPDKPINTITPKNWFNLSTLRR